MSDTVIQPPNTNDGFYRLLMEVREKVVAVEIAQRQLTEQFREFHDDFDDYKSWSQRLIYLIVLLMILGAAILLALIITRRILV